MLPYIARRILLSAFTVWVMSALTFVVMMLPEGDFVDELIRNSQKAAGDDARRIEVQLREYYGLDKPAIVQYYNWARRIVTKLEFAHSFGYVRGGGCTGSDCFIASKSVTDLIGEPI